ncbi:glycoside hydrolase family 9 protein [Cohnella cellulosilytica]|uniref:Endoglucanase n=1 Tax=Cohnella cellulosilytica TaxID=986710 RepID=A0ABW2FK87_9BACL
MSRNKGTKIALGLALLGGAVLQGCLGGDQAAPTRSSTPSPSALPAPPSEDEGPGPARELRIHVNQVGYETEGPKVAVIAADEAFPELEAVVADRDGNERTVWEGKVPAARYDELSGDWVAQVDIGGLETAGWYRIEAEGSVSVPFYIGDSVYDDLIYRVSRSYRMQRSGQALDDPQLGLKLQAGHLQDKEAEPIFEDEQGRRPVIDASGGWYDAGDYGKYVPPAAIAAAQMMLAYELRPEFFAARRFLLDGERAHWEAAESAPDLLAEIKFELDWLLRMQREDGAVYHKISGGVFPDFIPPAEDVQQRSVYGMSTYGTAMFAAATAMGARVYKPFDSDYADELLSRAERAQRWLEAHPEPYFRLDDMQDSGSGPYDKTTDREERYWALAELFRTTGEDRYGKALANDYADLSAGLAHYASWNDGQLLGQWAEAAAGSGTAAQAIADAANEMAGSIGRDGYRSALTGGDYRWASNKVAMAKAELLLLANELRPNPDYFSGAVDQLHYVLGRNAMGTSYVTGAGTRYARYPHHRISAASGILVPGLLVGGPNRDLNDPVLEKLADQGLPPAKSYIDDLLSYASNEYAIDYNAPLLFVLAFMD